MYFQAGSQKQPRLADQAVIAKFLKKQTSDNMVYGKCVFLCQTLLSDVADTWKFPLLCLKQLSIQHKKLPQIQCLLDAFPKLPYLLAWYKLCLPLFVLFMQLCSKGSTNFTLVIMCQELYTMSTQICATQTCPRPKIDYVWTIQSIWSISLFECSNMSRRHVL